MWGPFARLFAQVGLVVGAAVGRAFIQAYKEAAAKGAANPTLSIRRKMTLEEACKILTVDTHGATSKAIEERATLLYELNAKSEDFVGSPYLQTKIVNAKTVLEEHLLKAQLPKEGDKEGEDGSKPAT
eukprot:Platyproteum_vivax@DN2399_c0_g1_i1.p1